MAIDVLIKQKLFGNKVMPLEVILGENLKYGDYECDKLSVGVLGDSEFIAYNPNSIGRGFSVVWTPKEKKSISLRLPIPSTTQELTDFYAAVERMAKYWNAKLVVDGNKVSLDSFMAGFQDMVQFNEKAIQKFSQLCLAKEHETLFLYSAMWPLAAGEEEATLFLNNPDSYAAWLHEKQSMDVYFPSPTFYMYETGILARYLLFSDLPTVLPNQPVVPIGTMDPATGKPLECKQWMVSLRIAGALEPLCEMEYSKFLSILPDQKKSKYDAAHFLLSEFTAEELKALSLQ